MKNEITQDDNFKLNIGDIVNSGKKTKYLILDRFIRQNNKYYIIKCLKCGLIKEYTQYGLIRGDHDCNGCLNEFKIKNNTIYKDDKRNFTIINGFIERKNNRLYRKYNYKCNICGYEGVIEENKLIKYKRGCPCCSNKKAVLGVNTIWDKARWMVSLGVSEEDAKTHLIRSNKNIIVKCPICGKSKTTTPDKIYENKSISCGCEDKRSFPERIMYALLCFINIDFITQLTSKDSKWCGKYRYDFYFTLDGEKYIIETHGEQHYKESFLKSKNRRSLEEEQNNDKLKYELAIKNGIKPENYIIIDCRYSDIEFIKNNILNSRLSEIFDLNNIDWNIIFNNSLTSLIILACEYRNKYNLSTYEVSKIIKVGSATVRKYFKKGNLLGLCKYDPDEEKNRTRFKNYFYDNHKQEIINIINSTSSINKAVKIIKSIYPDCKITYATLKKYYNKWIGE